MGDSERAQLPEAELTHLMIRPDTGLTWLCLAAYFFSGSIAILFPSILPAIIRQFGLSLTAAGLLFPASAIGSLAGILAGVWSDRVGRKPLLAVGGVLVAIGLFVAAHAGAWWVFLGAFLWVGIAQSALSIGINALVLDLSAQRHGRAINTLHGAYGLGATVSPLFIGWTLRFASWRAALIGVAVIWLLLGLIACSLRYPAAIASGAQARSFRWNTLDRGIFFPLFAIAFLYNGVAWSLLGWVKVYMQASGMRSSFLSTGMISLFYAALTAGRFTCARLSDRLGYGKTLLICAIGSTLAYPLVTFNHHLLLMASGVFCSGLFLSGLYPTAIAYGTRLYPAQSGAITGAMSTALTLGSMLPPWWTGIVADRRGLPLAIDLNYLLVVPLIWIAWRLQRQDQSEQPPQPM